MSYFWAYFKRNVRFFNGSVKWNFWNHYKILFFSEPGTPRGFQHPEFLDEQEQPIFLVGRW